LAEILIVYATLQGHTLRVAERVAEHVAAAGHRPALTRVDAAPAPTGFDAAIVGAPVQAGHFAAAVVEYATAHATELARRPSGLFFVCLTAAQNDDASRATVDGYLRTFQRQTGWTPDVVASFAGALPTEPTTLLHRALMRDVVARSGRAGHVFTDWDAVGGFVEAFVHHVRRADEPGLSSARRASA
jgi:menaquinone-dependent protoporphyrinogen oxidase